jgi:hypothetical protein
MARLLPGDGLASTLFPAGFTVTDAHTQAVELSLGFGSGGVVSLFDGLVQPGKPVERHVSEFVRRGLRGSTFAHSQVLSGVNRDCPEIPAELRRG